MLPVRYPGNKKLGKHALSKPVTCVPTLSINPTTPIPVFGEGQRCVQAGQVVPFAPVGVRVRAGLASSASYSPHMEYKTSWVKWPPQRSKAARRLSEGVLICITHVRTHRHLPLPSFPFPSIRLVCGVSNSKSMKYGSPVPCSISTSYGSTQCPWPRRAVGI